MNGRDDFLQGLSRKELNATEGARGPAWATGTTMHSSWVAAASITEEQEIFGGEIFGNCSITGSAGLFQHLLICGPVTSNNGQVEGQVAICQHFIVSWILTHTRGITCSKL